MAFIKGFPADTFPACRARAHVVRLADTHIPVLNLDDLITAKAALDRHKDRADLEQLRQLRDLAEEE